MATLDLLLHPVRLRILQALLDGHPSTTTQLRQRLPDIAPATMYRHVAVLAECERDLSPGSRDRGALRRVRRGALYQGARLLGLSGGEADVRVPDQQVGIVRVEAEALEERALGLRQAALGPQ